MGEECEQAGDLPAATDSRCLSVSPWHPKFSSGRGGIVIFFTLPVSLPGESAKVRGKVLTGELAG